MFLHLDPSNGIAIFDQISRQLKYAIADGAIKPGSLVPSVRELAQSAAVNPNTVARAYRDLQADGVLQPVRGMGLEVTATAPKRCRDDRIALIRGRVRSVVTEVRHAGLEDDELRQLVEQEFKRPLPRKERE